MNMSGKMIVEVDDDFESILPKDIRHFGSVEFDCTTCLVSIIKRFSHEEATALENQCFLIYTDRLLDRNRSARYIVERMILGLEVRRSQ
jgi:hypothetical protein